MKRTSMVLPVCVPIGGKDYYFYLDDTMYIKRGELGMCEFDLDPSQPGKITLDPAVHPNEEAFLHTIIHEIKHAQQNEYGMAQAMEHSLREVDAETTATTLLKIFDITFKKSLFNKPKSKKKSAPSRDRKKKTVQSL